jgi:hypothetical protein
VLVEVGYWFDCLKRSKRAAGNQTQDPVKASVDLKKQLVFTVLYCSNLTYVFDIKRPLSHVTEILFCRNLNVNRRLK